VGEAELARGDEIRGFRVHGWAAGEGRDAAQPFIRGEKRRNAAGRAQCEGGGELERIQGAQAFGYPEPAHERMGGSAEAQIVTRVERQAAPRQVGTETSSGHVRGGGLEGTGADLQGNGGFELNQGERSDEETRRGIPEQSLYEGRSAFSVVELDEGARVEKVGGQLSLIPLIDDGLGEGAIEAGERTLDVLMGDGVVAGSFPFAVGEERRAGGVHKFVRRGEPDGESHFLRFRESQRLSGVKKALSVNGVDALLHAPSV